MARSELRNSEFNPNNVFFLQRVSFNHQTDIRFFIVCMRRRECSHCISAMTTWSLATPLSPCVPRWLEINKTCRKQAQRKTCFFWKSFTFHVYEMWKQSGGGGATRCKKHFPVWDNQSNFFRCQHPFLGRKVCEKPFTYCVGFLSIPFHSSLSNRWNENVSWKL